jgi:hypothetical protein
MTRRAAEPSFMGGCGKVVALVGDRLVVGRVALDHVAGVRILLPQPTNLR